MGSIQPPAKSVLNVGGGSKDIPLPQHYAGWKHDLLDIDARVNPDVVMDARTLDHLPAGTYDAVYCAHNLEHYHRADGLKVLHGFHHVLKDGGFAEVCVPDVLAVIRHVAAHDMDLDDVLYTSPDGPILVRDVIYGYHPQVEHRGNDYYAHKTGFSPQSLQQFFRATPFHSFAIFPQGIEIRAYLFKGAPGPELRAMLGITE